MTGDQRERVLTDADINELLVRLDESAEARWTKQMETIGLDVRTPESRNAIRANQEFISELRSGTSKFKIVSMMALMTAILGGVGKIFWDGAQHMLTVLARAKGAS